MTNQLISPKLLNESNKILFIAHLALGDFTYMQNCFLAFSKAFPHIKMHLWIDELRRTNDESQWDHLKKYALYDWVCASNLFEKIYTRTYSPALFNESIKEAQSENYPVAVSLATMHRHRYVLLARRICPTGFVVAQKKPVVWYDIIKRLIYKKLDAYIPAYQVSPKQQNGLHDIAHISQIYANWFFQLFGITIPQEALFPYVDTPPQWHEYAKRQFELWGFHRDEKTLFLNGFSKSVHRSWPLERVIDLAVEIQKNPDWQKANIIINVVPESLSEAKSLFSEPKLKQLSNVQLFSAEDNFFQLPAILSLCQLIISVETAVMHLANAVHVPVIALMRQTTPEWAPINPKITTIVKTQDNRAWVDTISVQHVINALS